MVNQIERFLSDDECDKLISMIQSNNQKSTVVLGGTNKSGYDSSRTSSTSNLAQTDLVKDVKQRIANKLNLRVNQGESLQGQLYNEGEYFKPHNDWFGFEAMKTHGQVGGQRTHTLMIYLNDDFEGGETNFPNKSISVAPKKGKAVWWRNTLDSGQGDPKSLHEGSTVTKGSKYIITAWFREEDYIKTSNSPRKSVESSLPRLTALGFKKIKVPEKTWRLIKETYALLKPREEQENFEGKKDIILGSGNTTLFPLHFVPEIRDIIHKQLHQIHQDWAGVEIEQSALYGIRSYKKAASLAMHKDRAETHHISSIILVDKDLRCGCQNKEFGNDWPLNIIDHNGNEHSVYLEPGEMVLYESAVCEHGRKNLFEGEFFNNMFVHYKIT